MVFARQELPLVRTEISVENLAAKGGYVLHEAQCAARQVTLLATGSEVSIAVAARAQLEAQGVGTAVVSLPCWELFDQQSADYRRQVLGEGALRVGIEAAMRFGWDQYIGLDGIFIGMSGYGLSGPAEELFEHFGITAKDVVRQVTARLAT